MKRMVLGFCFSEDNEWVLLIRKQRPLWQMGLLNGIGGKIEGEETPVEAMVREFREETGVESSQSDWKPLCFMHGVDRWEVSCFVCHSNLFVDLARTTTDEEVVMVKTDLNQIRKEGISNLPWLIGMALDSDQPFFSSRVEYQ